MKTTTFTKVNFYYLSEYHKYLFKKAEQYEFYSTILEAGYNHSKHDYISSVNSNTEFYVKDIESIKFDEIEDCAKELGEGAGQLFIENKIKEEDWESERDMLAMEAAEEEFLE